VIPQLLVLNRAPYWNGAITVHTYAAQWWRFTKPLIVVRYYLPMISPLGLFVIQKWYGSVEQRCNVLALQWRGLAMVLTNSGVWIFRREALACWLSASSGLLVQVLAGERLLGSPWRGYVRHHWHS